MARRCFNMLLPFYAVSKWGDATVGGSSDGSLSRRRGRRSGSSTCTKRRCWPSEPRTAAFAPQATPMGLCACGPQKEEGWTCNTLGPRRSEKSDTSLPTRRASCLRQDQVKSWSWPKTARSFPPSKPTPEAPIGRAVHPTKSVTLSTGQDGELVAHDGRQEVLRMPVHKSAVYRARMHGRLLWTASRDHDVKAWDLNTFDAVHKLHMPHTRSVNALALGGVDGTHVATGGDDRSVKVWHASLSDTHH